MTPPEESNPELDAAIAALGKSSKTTAILTGGGACLIVAAFISLIAGYNQKEQQVEDLRLAVRHAPSDTQFAERLSAIDRMLAAISFPQEQSDNLVSLARTYIRTEDYGRAERLLREALQVAEERFGPDHPTTATSLANLATFDSIRGRYEEAKTLYRRALTISEKALGPQSAFTARLLTQLAAQYEKSGDLPLAAQLRERADSIYRELNAPK